MDEPIITFATLQTRLLQFINLRIANGEFTERGLARLIGVSQPQLHNVLKGKRKLQTELADRMMKKFDIGVLDLFHETELREQLITRVNTRTQEIRGSVTPLERPSTGSESCPHKPVSRLTLCQPPVKDLAS